MAELAKEYGLSDESRVRDWLKSYNGHRKFERHSAARGALYMTKRYQKRLRCMTPMEFHAAA